MSSTLSERLLREGSPREALRALEQEVRGEPANYKLRVFLFQLLAVLGEWERALMQLNTAAQLDAEALAMAHMYREAIRCELLRAKVFAGEKAPMIFGEPEAWLALMIESLLVEGKGDRARGMGLREQALEQAEASAGQLDGKPFEWIADGDSRLGPILEVIVNGRYYWAPFNHLVRVAIEAPSDLRDLVWAPAHLFFANGGETVALIPTRYPGSESSDDDAILMSRKTTWQEVSPGNYHGLGQRVLTTDQGEFDLLSVRSIELAPTS